MDKDLRPRQLTGYSRRTHLSNALFLLPTIVLFTFVVLIPFFRESPIRLQAGKVSSAPIILSMGLQIINICWETSIFACPLV